MVFLLITEWFAAELTVFLTLAAITLLGILTPIEALSGFSNPGIHTVALLFIIGSAASKNGIFHQIIQKTLGKSSKLSTILLRLMAPVSLLSAFMNNTPIVAMLTPLVRRWGINNRIPPSKLLIPLSYAAILGGTITLIGTSTNLLVDSLLKEKGFPGLTMFNFALFGIPLSIIGILYITFIGKHLLPARTDLYDSIKDMNKKLMFEFTVQSHSSLIGKTITEANLRKLKDLFLIQIIREQKTILPAPHYEVIQSGDRLIFSGSEMGIYNLQKIKGLKLSSPKQDGDMLNQRQMVEVVISHHSSLIGKTVKESQFRSKFNAVIIAIQRKNKNLTSRIGYIPLKAGDTLLLLTGNDFASLYKNDNDFHLITEIEVEPYRTKSSKIVISVILGIVIMSAMQILTIYKASLLGVIVLFITKTISVNDAKKAINWNIIILMSSAIGIGKAIEQTGLASIIANQFTVWNAFLGLAGISILLYLTTAFMTEIINNLAAAALMFPISFQIATEMGFDPTLFAMIIAISSSCSFITPIGYQTNLIVYGPGGYHFLDYVKVGLPLSLLSMGTTILIAVNFFY